jgi:DNA polymerase
MRLDAELEALYRAQDTDPAFEQLRATARFVPGDGGLRPKAIFVGEAPGRIENKIGSPFVGPSGRFLDELLRIAHLDRELEWVTNVVKYRPPRNRTPTEEEIEASRPYFRKEVALVGRNGCRVLVGLGRTACEAIAGEAISPTRKHATWVELRNGWRLFVSCHPSWGIRDPANADNMRDDFLQLGYDLGTVIND